MSTPPICRSRVVGGPSILAAIAAAVAILSLVSCGGAGGRTEDASAGSVGSAAGMDNGEASASGDVAALWHDFAQCLRDHGSPSLADPQILASGAADWGDQIQEFRRALGRVEGSGTRGEGSGGPCDDELRALPERALNPPPTPDELEELVQLARCMREQGVMDWPDPNPDGSFAFGERLRGLDKVALSNMIEPCRHLLSGNVAVLGTISPGKE